MNRVYIAALVIFIVTIGCAQAPYHPPDHIGDPSLIFEPAFGTTPPGGGGGGADGDSGGSGEGGEGGEGGVGGEF